MLNFKEIEWVVTEVYSDGGQASRPMSPLFNPKTPGGSQNGIAP